jgi:outer membrane immunogenic protein
MHVGAMGLLLSVLPAAAQSSDAILQRLERLEKENSELRERVRRLEKPQVETGSLKPTSAAVVVPKDPAPIVSRSLQPTASRMDAPGSSDPAAERRDRWSGFYLGVHGGYGSSKNDFATVVPFDPTLTIGGIDADGGVFGGHAGYNWQRGAIVAGLEIDISASNMRGHSNTLTEDLGGGVLSTVRFSDDIQYLGSARARLGLAMGSAAGPSLMLYATGGLAWERVDRTETFAITDGFVTDFARMRTPHDYFGFVIGAGAEAMLGSGDWIARLEYLHYDFGSVEQTIAQDVVFFGPPGTFADREGRQTIDVVRGGVSYKF